MQKAIGIKKIAKTKLKVKKILLPIMVGFFIFLILASIGTLIYIESFRDKIYPGVSVASFDIGGFDKTRVLDTIQKRIDKLNSIGLVFSSTNEGEKTINYKDLGITFDKEKTYQNAYNNGRNKVSDISNVSDIYKTLIKGENIPLVLNFDNEKFESKVNELESSKIKTSKDATFEIENDELVIIDEENGVEINFLLLKNDIQQLASSENIYKKINVSTQNKDANITADDIRSVKNNIDAYLDKQIVYKNNLVQYIPTKNEMVKWFSVEKHSAPRAQISDENVKEYIEMLASKIDKKAVDKKINIETNEVIFEGSDGVVLDQEKAIIDTKSALNSGKNENIINLKTKIQEKKEIKVQPPKEIKSGGTPGLASGKYIEVNLKTQKLYLFDGENEEGAYSVSTGKWDMPTPVGTRTISGKSDRAWSAKYGLYMPYWMDIGGGYGIHELPEWPNGYKEGESHLGTPVSHGCIRLGVGAAGNVYAWSPVGTPVFIHY